ncbi:MAG TPA: response regulator transcription factor [Patescibacteria group bacterium]|nr:response regulator transcription factor [Patescibacteria group bacterium]
MVTQNQDDDMPGSKGKILVIEDDEAISDAVQMILNSSGYTVRTLAEGGEKMRELIQADKPDVIILDMLLSREDGRIVCKKLKEDLATKQIPVIVISAHPDGRTMAASAGADDFLPKPFTINDLLATVEKYG